MKTFDSEVYFIEQETKNEFYARPAPSNSWGAKHGATHVITYNTGHELRYAEIGATVAYIYVDEDSEGKPVKEKWDIRHQC